MTPTTITLGYGENKTNIAKIGHGLMLMTMRPDPLPDDVAFESIKASLDFAPPGAKMLLNSGEFYGNNPREANLQLLARFFEKYPDYADKAFINVKGGFNVRGSVDNILSELRGTKKLDLFECARVNPNVPIETTIKALSTLVTEGKVDYIGISECNAETLRRACSVHPIAMVEIEVSPWSFEEETRKVIAVAKEFRVVVCAYSPLGHGFLTGSIKRPEDLPANDLRRNLTRFKDENMKHNFAIVDGLSAIAQKKGITAAQLCIAWVSSLGPHVVPIPGSSHKNRTSENIEASKVTLSQEERSDIEILLKENPVKGDRYFGGSEKDTLLWG